MTLCWAFRGRAARSEMLFVGQTLASGRVAGAVHVEHRDRRNSASISGVL